MHAIASDHAPRGRISSLPTSPPRFRRSRSSAPRDSRRWTSEARCARYPTEYYLRAERSLERARGRHVGREQGTAHAGPPRRRAAAAAHPYNDTCRAVTRRSAAHSVVAGGAAVRGAVRRVVRAAPMLRRPPPGARCDAARRCIVGCVSYAYGGIRDCRAGQVLTVYTRSSETRKHVMATDSSEYGDRSLSLIGAMRYTAAIPQRRAIRADSYCDFERARACPCCSQSPQQRGPGIARTSPISAVRMCARGAARST